MIISAGDGSVIISNYFYSINIGSFIDLFVLMQLVIDPWQRSNTVFPNWITRSLCLNWMNLLNEGTQEEFRNHC